MDDPNPPGYGRSLPSGYGQSLSSGSGRPHPQTVRGQLVPSHDASQRHQLDQKRLRALYPVIPAALASKDMRMLHPVRYMPPPGAFYDLHDKERVRFPYSVKKSCKVCMGEKHVDSGQPCHRTCLACGGTHPTAPCPQIYNTVRSWKRFGWRMDEQSFGIPATTQVKPSDDEVVLLKANGYVAHDWVYDVKQAPVFLDGAWNRERRSLGLSASISVPYPRTSSSLSARMSYGHNTYRNDQNPYGHNTYRNEQNSYRNDRRSRSPRRDTYDQRSRSSYRSPSRGRGRGRDSPIRYRDRSSARNESPSFLDQVVQGVVQSILASKPTRTSPPRSPARHNHMNRRAPPAPSSLTQNQQAHSALPRSGRFDTPRTVNQRARPAPSRRTDLGVSDAVDSSAKNDEDKFDIDLEYR